MIYTKPNHVDNRTGLMMNTCGKNCMHNEGMPPKPQQDLITSMIHSFWNRMTKDQRNLFIKHSQLDLLDSSKIWFELDDVQKYTITKYFYIMIWGVSI